jgi:hypothetical protein
MRNRRNDAGRRRRHRGHSYAGTGSLIHSVSSRRYLLVGMISDNGGGSGAGFGLGAVSGLGAGAGGAGAGAFEVEGDVVGGAVGEGVAWNGIAMPPDTTVINSATKNVTC